MPGTLGCGAGGKTGLIVLVEKVLILPGIGASCLEPADGRWRFGPGLPAGAVISPDRLALADDNPLQPVGVLNRCIGVQHLAVVPGYDLLARRMSKAGVAGRATVAKGPNPADDFDRQAQVIIVPYDFRRSNAESARWLARVVNECLSSEDHVTVVAHSMGGLVASYWFAVLGGWRRCRSLITVGTPHRGAPKALDWLVNPTRSPLRRPAVTEVFRTWDSMWELLPDYPMLESDGQWRIPAEVPNIDDLTFDGFGRRARRALKFHRMLDSAWRDLDLEQQRKLTCLLGFGHATPSSAGVRGSGGRLRLAISNQPPPAQVDGPVLHGGDHTVPHYSSWIEVDQVMPETLPDRHAPLWNTSAVASKALAPLVPRLGHVRGEPAARPGWVLDTDLPDELPLGQAQQIRAKVGRSSHCSSGGVAPLGSGNPSEKAEGLEGSAAQLEICRVNPASQPCIVNLCADGQGRWRGEFPALRDEGVYLVTCRVAAGSNLIEDTQLVVAIPAPE
ncbi:MAG: hypothetical protein LBC97_03780 [Bifidobacteriaceae bacterium]|nr:hypothetical protein [Bifidobacteriaceae bacterium]